MSIQKQGQIKPSQTTFIKSDTKVPDKGRKSLTKEIKGQEEVIPQSSTLSALAFLPLFGCFELFKVEFVRRMGSGCNGFKLDYFMIMVWVWLGCSVVKRGKRVRGVSVSALCMLMYSSDNSGFCRGVNRKLSLLVSSGLLVRERSVSSSGYYLYSVSVQAEKLLLTKVDVKVIRELNALVKSVL